LKGGEFLRKLHSLSRRNGVSYLFVPAKGKGSHGKVYFGTASTIVKDRKKELGIGLLCQMCKDLGISPEEL
jgi:hypothetical protein